MSNPIPNMTDEQVQRFWSKVDRRSKDECWEWMASLKQGVGYGQLGIGPRKSKTMLYAHRVAYKLYYGIDPGNRLVCHTCDNRRCCNPHHLWLGTYRDNRQDALQKGRCPKTNPKLRGNKNALAKLTDAKVREARKLWESGQMGSRALGRKYGVSHATIHAAVQHQTWKHVV